MAVLALAAAGAALAPAGYAAIGWTIGSVAGQLLFAKHHNIQQEGPRLTDLSVQTSTDGAPLLEIFGTVRVAGNILWSAGIKETKNVTEQDVGGKGGGGTTVTSTNYTYSCSFALGLCDGPIIGVRRLWADGKLLYSASPTADPATIASSANLLGVMTVYLGTETQLPDPLIESYKGVGNVPGYRGQAYIVFENLPLANYGNRLPNFTAEVVTVGTLSRMTRIQSWARPSVSFVYDAGTILAQTISISGATFVRNLKRYALDGTPLESTTTSLPTIDSDTSASFSYVKNNARLFVGRRNGAGTSNVSALYSDQGILARPISPPTSLSADDYYSIDSAHSADPAVTFGKILYTRGWNPASNAMWIARYQLDSASPMAPLFPDAYVSISSGAIVSFSINVDERGHVYAYFIDTGEIREYSPDLVLISTWTGGPTLANTDFVMLYGRAYLHVSSELREYLLPTGGGSITLNYSITLPSYLAGAFYLTDGLIFDGAGIVSLIDTITSGAAPLASVVSTICSEAGLTSGQIDVTALTGNVEGYVRTQPMTARAALEPLMRAFFFDAIESGNVIKFVPRGGASSTSIPVADLAAHADGESLPDAICIERTQESELPREVVVLYMDAAADYQQGSQAARRLVTKGRDSTTIELPMVLTADRARQVAEVLLTDAWMARRSYPISLPPKYIDIEPTDVITLADTAATHVVRIIDQEIGANGVIRLQAVAEAAAVYTSTAAGAAPAIAAQSLPMVGPTALQLLDIPLLRDQDDNIGYYLAAAGYLSAWKGAVIEQSRDAGESWSDIASKLTPAVMGFATNILAAGPVALWDHAASVNVRIPIGTLSSTTDDGVLSGGNVALLGAHGRWEVLQFRDAVLQGDGTWTLTHFLRGCFGTEYAVDKHAANDAFILITATSLLRMLQAQSDIGLALKYHALSIGAPAYTPVSVDFTNTDLGQRPYPVSQLAGIKQSNGDWLIQWQPRVRKSQSWMARANIAADPAITGYQVDIFSGSTLKRSVYITGSTSFTYPLAGQANDFGTGQSTLKIRVYGYNSAVGLGYGVEITAPAYAETYLLPVAFTATAYAAATTSPTAPAPTPTVPTTRISSVHYYSSGFYGSARDDNNAGHVVVGDATAATWEVRGALNMGISRGAKTSSYHGYMINNWFGRSTTAADGSWTYVQRDLHPQRNVGGGYYYDMISDGTRFIACGARGILESTTDFVTWTEHAVGQIGLNAELEVVRYGNSAYLVHGTDSGVRKLWRSTDRVTWTDVTPAAFTDHRIIDMIYAGSKWVMVGSRPNQYSQTLPAIWTSTDNGVTWTLQTDGGTVGQTAAYVAHNGSVFVVTGYRYRATSSDGVTWTAATDDAMTYQGKMVANGSLIVAADAQRGVLRKTTDGITWTDIQ